MSIRIPRIYQAARLRAVLPADEDGDRAMGFDMPDGSILRIRLSSQDAQHLAENLTRQCAAHFEWSCGISSSSSSTPHDGVNVCPPEASDAADCGDGYQPSHSSPSIKSHPPREAGTMETIPARVE